MISNGHTFSLSNVNAYNIVIINSWSENYFCFWNIETWNHFIQLILDVLRTMKKNVEFCWGFYISTVSVNISIKSFVVLLILDLFN
jgi:hypothetical protein